jgi:hypothetical protein
MANAEATEVVDAQVVEEGAPPNGQVVVHRNDAPVELFPGSSPTEIIQQATAVADALKPILANQGMATRIGKKDHVKIEGWQTLGAVLKVTPVCISTRRIEPKTTFTVKGKKRKWGKVDGRRQVTEEFDYSYEVEGYSWEATVEARTLDGRVIGSADAMCSREEDKWKDSDEFAVRSMAQTRASSKALASVLRFIVTLAGYSGTPAEEMPSGGAPQSTERAEPPRPPLPAERVQKIGQGIGALELTYKDVGLLLGAVGADNHFEESSGGLRSALAQLTPDQADQIEGRLEARAAQDAGAERDTPAGGGSDD